MCWLFFFALLEKVEGNWREWKWEKGGVEKKKEKAINSFDLRKKKKNDFLCGIFIWGRFLCSRCFAAF